MARIARLEDVQEMKKCKKTVMIADSLTRKTGGIGVFFPPNSKEIEVQLIDSSIAHRGDEQQRNRNEKVSRLGQQLST